MRELASCIPNSEIRLRKGADMKHIIPMAVEKGFTAIISLEEHHKIPSILFSLQYCVPCDLH